MSAQDHYDMVELPDGFGGAYTVEQPQLVGSGLPCGGAMPSQPQACGGCPAPAPVASYQSFPVGQEVIFEFLSNLRYQVMTMGLQVALNTCRQEGPFLAGFAVYCHPADDRIQLRALVEEAGGQWLENAPDAGFSQAVPTLIFCQLPDAANFQQQQQWQGMGSAPSGGQRGGWGGGGGGSRGGGSSGGWGNQGGAQKSWSSTSPYVDSYLQPSDASSYSAAGLQLWRRGKAGVELLLPLERPWNSFINAYDPLAWNVIGAKKSGWEHSPRETAVRCMLEVLGGISEAPREKELHQMCKQSVAVWYPRGKFALFLHEVSGLDASWDNPGLSERFKEAKGRPRADQFGKQIKYPKEIDDFEWVPGKELMADKPRQPLTDLLESLCRIGGFQAFLSHGSLPPVLDNGGNQTAEDTGVVRRPVGEPSYVDSSSMQTGAPARGKAVGVSGSGGKSCGKSDCKTDGKAGKTQAGRGKGFHDAGARGAAKGHDSEKGQGKSGGKVGKGSAAKPSAKDSVPGRNQQKQSVGERLYVLVQAQVQASTPNSKQVPAFLVAQKITGMLLELPEPELLILLDPGPQGHAELVDRVREATEILQEQGFV